MKNSTIVMSPKEASRVPILNDLLEKRITEAEAWKLIGISERQVRRIFKEYKKDWPQGILHKSRWEPSNNKKIDNPIIIDVIKSDDFHGFRPTFATEKLDDIYGIKISHETMRTIMTDCWIRHPKDKEHHIYRQCRPRKDYVWEMEQFDGSYHLRFEDRNWEFCLLLAVDDATSKIMQAIFWDNESYENVVRFWMEYVCLYWVPKFIYLDKFSTYKVNHPKAKYEKDMITHFASAMRQLWCTLIFANSPEAKWRVEKCNWTLQERLVNELRLQKISTVDEANKYLKEIFIPKYNEKFAVEAKQQTNLHQSITQEQKDQLLRIFARKEERILARDYVIQYKKRCFQIEKPINDGYLIYPKKHLVVLETIDNKLRITSWWKDVLFKEIDYNTIRKRRAIHYSKLQQIVKVAKQKDNLKRKEEKYINSKQRQRESKAQKLFDIVIDRKSKTGHF